MALLASRHRAHGVNRESTETLALATLFGSSKSSATMTLAERTLAYRQANSSCDSTRAAVAASARKLREATGAARRGVAELRTDRAGDRVAHPAHAERDGAGRAAVDRQQVQGRRGAVAGVEHDVAGARQMLGEGGERLARAQERAARRRARER